VVLKLVVVIIIFFVAEESRLALFVETNNGEETAQLIN
jgi:hypothetical protein